MCIYNSIHAIIEFCHDYGSFVQYVACNGVTDCIETPRQHRKARKAAKAPAEAHQRAGTTLMNKARGLPTRLNARSPAIAALSSRLDAYRSPQLRSIAAPRVAAQSSPARTPPARPLCSATPSNLASAAQSSASLTRHTLPRPSTCFSRPSPSPIMEHTNPAKRKLSSGTMSFPSKHARSDREHSQNQTNRHRRSQSPEDSTMTDYNSYAEASAETTAASGTGSDTPRLVAASGATDSAEWQQTIQRVVKCVVSIHFCQTASFDTDISMSSEATGFVVDAERGYILTNRHVVCAGPFWGYVVFDNHEEVSFFTVLLPCGRLLMSYSAM